MIRWSLTQTSFILSVRCCHFTGDLMLGNNPRIHYHLRFLNLLLPCQSSIRLESTLLRWLLCLIHRCISCWSRTCRLRNGFLLLIRSFRGSHAIWFDLLLTRISCRLLGHCTPVYRVFPLWLADTLCSGRALERVPVPLPLILLDQVVFGLRRLRELLKLSVNLLDDLHCLRHFLL